MSYEGHVVVEERVKETIRVLMAPLKELLDSPTLTDLHINANGTVFSKRIDGIRRKEKLCFENSTIETIAALLASKTNNDVSENSPDIAASWDEPPMRIQITLPPVVPLPTMSIRKHGMLDVSLADLEESKVITPVQLKLLSSLVKAKKNIVVSGGMGSGKTTLVNSLIREIPSTERLFVIQDTAELNLTSCPDHVEILVDGTKFTARHAVFTSMRSDADRIIIGEVRDGAALELLKAWNTGHRGGLGTIHANSIDSVFLRFKVLIMEASVSPLPDLVEEALDALVQISMTKEGRRVTDIRVLHPDGLDLEDIYEKVE